MRFASFIKPLLFRDKHNVNAYFKGKLANVLGFKPNDYKVYMEALTHRSAKTKKGEGKINYERLEFLGDAILGASVAKYLYNNAPGQREGYLTQMRSKIVSRKHLNKVGESIGLKGLINSSKNALQSSDIYGDVFEALIGAIFMDKGFEKTECFIQKNLINKYVNLKELEMRIASYKSLVIEWAQKQKQHVDFFTEMEAESKENPPVFSSLIRIGDNITAKGRGTSKKKAEEKAAQRAYFFMQGQSKRNGK